MRTMLDVDLTVKNVTKRRLNRKELIFDGLFDAILVDLIGCQSHHLFVLLIHILCAIIYISIK